MIKALKNTVSALCVACMTGYVAQADRKMDLVAATVNKGGWEAFCRKADAMSGNFSIRSFNGVLCSNKTLASLALKMCQNQEFKTSQCYKNAIKVVGNSKNLEANILQEIKASDSKTVQAVPQTIQPESKVSKSNVKVEKSEAKAIISEKAGASEEKEFICKVFDKLPENFKAQARASCIKK